MMNRKTLGLVAAIVGVVPLLIGSSAYREENSRGGNGSNKRIVVAAFGDWPYSQALLNSAPLLLNSINSDPNVRLVIHVGDIHSGSMPCTGIGLSPVPKTSVPEWNKWIFDIFGQFNAPLVYTPGDNEWTDCHKTKEFTSGAPMNELAAVRGLFFPQPGVTLGGLKKNVMSQARAFDPRFPADAKFVENVVWEESSVVFVTLNLPGSNNDGLPWLGGSATVPGNYPFPPSPFLNEEARKQEVAERGAANLRWLDAAFDQAEQDGARGVLIAIQADMWDPAAAVPGGDGLDGYDEFVQELARRVKAFGGPVLLINGDSHVFEADKPLSAAFYADPTTVGDFHKVGYAVENLNRITVQGSTNKPAEWVRITVDPRTEAVFTWENVVYCDGTNTACFP